MCGEEWACADAPRFLEVDLATGGPLPGPPVRALVSLLSKPGSPPQRQNRCNRRCFKPVLTVQRDRLVMILDGEAKQALVFRRIFSMQ